MKTHILGFLLLLFVSSTVANTIIVDQNGAGQYTKIQDAINAANTNDTIIVWPGTYNEQLTLNKNVVLQGSGYENTVITGSFNPTLTMSAGKLLWFLISSTGGIGIELSGGIVSNCLITSCQYSGIESITGTSTVLNCVFYNNGQHGVVTWDVGVITVSNCICVGSSEDAYNSWRGTIYLSYSLGAHVDTQGNQGCLNADPMFYSTTDYHISQGSPCWNTGNPALNDPDGTRSDMGYFGGPDCPIYPVVYEIFIQPNGGLINLQAKGRANY